MAPNRGALIVIEGLDRAGKSTQHGMLCEHLQNLGYSVNAMRFPDRSTAIGSSISSYLKGASDHEDHVIHLLFSANRWEAASSIVQSIDSGTTVIIDRYYYSGIVYTAAKDKVNLTLQWCKAPDVGLPKPDLIIFLDIDLDAARGRGGFGDERYEKEKTQQRVRQLFYEVIEKEESVNKLTKVIDASRSLAEVAGEVQQAAASILDSKSLERPLERITP